MDDRGQKIVFLAKALLDSETVELRALKKTARVTMSFKMLCLTTLLAAAGGSIVTTTIHNNERPLNRYEKFELQALVFYAAKIRHVSEESMLHEVTLKTGIGNLDELTAQDFHSVRDFLCKKAQ